MSMLEKGEHLKENGLQDIKNSYNFIRTTHQDKANNNENVFS